MRVLLVKTSSMGDVIHTLPALTDARHAIPNIQFDWVVEEQFTDIPHWHPAVGQVFPVAMRRWRKSLIKTCRSGEYCRFKQITQQQPYDLILDAQGLFKSAWLTRGYQAPVAGLDKKSAREPIANWFYQKAYFVAKEQHAVERTRELFAKALAYEKPNTIGDYGLNKAALIGKSSQSYTAPYHIFLHGTTWASKHWPESEWRTLAEYFLANQQTVLLPWGNQAEYQRAQRIAEGLACVEVLPKLSIEQLAGVLAGASSCVAVDTGLGHLAAALDVPTISLYGPTRPEKVGAYGKGQVHLCEQGGLAGLGDRNKSCFSNLTASKVIAQIEQTRSGVCV